MYYISMKTPIGGLTLFADRQALVAIEFGQGPEGECSPLLNEAKAQLAAYFKGALKRFDLPLAAPGTRFQRACWNLMREIPYGNTRSYGDLADDLSSAPRAVGGACGKNPIPIIVPCHRVLASGGRIGGFSGGGGIDTKVFLLRLEGVNMERQERT